jgi:hypothetical protein
MNKLSVLIRAEIQSSASQQLFNELVKQRNISMEVTLGYMKPCQCITRSKKKREFEGLTTVSIVTAVLQSMTTCILVDRYHRFYQKFIRFTGNVRATPPKKLRIHPKKDIYYFQ